MDPDGDCFGSAYTESTANGRLWGRQTRRGEFNGCSLRVPARRGVWTQVQSLYSQAGAQVAGSFYGDAVSISGDYIFVGVPNENLNRPGTVDVFKQENGYWSWSQNLASGVTTGTNLFGHALDASNGWLMVGGYNETTEYGSGKGQVWAFKLEGGQWKRKLRLHAGPNSSGAAYTQFGSSVALDGDFLAIGANDNNFAGAVYTFTRSGEAGGRTSRLSARPRPGRASAAASAYKAHGCSSASPTTAIRPPPALRTSSSVRGRHGRRRRS